MNVFSYADLTLFEFCQIMNYLENNQELLTKIVKSENSDKNKG